MGNRESIAKEVWKKIFPFKKGDKVRVTVPERFESYCSYKRYAGRIGKIESTYGLVENSKNRNRFFKSRGEKDMFWIVVFRQNGVTSHIFIHEDHLEKVT